MKVEVYRNLHKDCWSVRDNKTGRVIDHVNYIHLHDATLVVRPSGREKVLREKRKNVHAFIKGTASFLSECGDSHSEQILYNPYKYDSFVLQDTEERITHAKHVYLDNEGKVFTGESIYAEHN